MTTAFLIDGFGIGGTELNATRTLEALARRNEFLSVLHFHEDGPLRARIAATGHTLVHVPIVPLSSPRIFGRILALAGAIRAQRATLVHTQDIYSNVLGAMATRGVLRRPLITSRRWKDDVPRPLLRPLNAWAHRRSTLVLPNSGALTDTLRAEGVSPGRIAVHENFIDDSALVRPAAGEIAAWRTALGIPLDRLVIGCVARLSRVKRHDVLLDAFAAVLTAMPSAHLVLVGDGDRRQPLEEDARDRGISAHVTFTGTLPNHPLPQHLFDIAVLTSENEGFPNSLVEAAACGVPIVSTMVGGAPDILRDGETGLPVQVGDAASTRAAILTLAQDPTARRTMGLAGRALVESRFSESAAIARLLGLYRRVSEPTARP